MTQKNFLGLIHSISPLGICFIFVHVTPKRIVKIFSNSLYIPLGIYVFGLFKPQEDSKHISFIKVLRGVWH